MFKKLYAELAEIKSGVLQIKSYIEPREDIGKGYTVKTFYPSLPSIPAAVSFQIPYPDWLKLEKSKEWKAFQKLLWEHQKEYNRKDLQVNSD